MPCAQVNGWAGLAPCQIGHRDSRPVVDGTIGHVLRLYSIRDTLLLLSQIGFFFCYYIVCAMVRPRGRGSAVAYCHMQWLICREITRTGDYHQRLHLED